MELLVILNSEGKMMGSGYFEEGNEPGFFTNVLPTENFVNGYFDKTKGVFYENATEQQIKESVANKGLIDLIRERYSIDDELSIQRQRDTKQAEFQEYFLYVENCKTLTNDR